ncbi:Pycsar system effector family protein [Pedobacter vanadiisoli]|uniref:Pycsar system effector family protein n=1 Tax=Pedobacter vanadiisoli TaxID=1761975 RepID=A0ABW5MKN8_9SPHI
MTKTVDYLQKQYDHAFEMVKFGEAKNTTLIAFNGAIIIGLAQLLKDINIFWIKYYLQYTILMCIISVFITFSSLIAKIKHTTNNTARHRNSNLMFFETLADLTHEELVTKLQTEYGCTSENQRHEEDIAKQVIITSQIASRKFKLFNLGMSFTFAGLLTPVILIIHRIFLDHDK